MAYWHPKKDVQLHEHSLGTQERAGWQTGTVAQRKQEGTSPSGTCFVGLTCKVQPVCY